MKRVLLLAVVCCLGVSVLGQRQVSKTLIHYPSSKFGLDDDAKAKVQSVYNTFFKNDDDGLYTLALFGYCDTTGSTQLNQKLSEKRAQGVFDYFVEISNGTITKKGCVHFDGVCKGDQKSCTFYTVPWKHEGRGEENCIALNNTEEGKAKNRRVEVIVYEDEKACVGEVTYCEYPTEDITLKGDKGSELVIPKAGLNIVPVFDGNCATEEISASFTETLSECVVVDSFEYVMQGSKTLYECGIVSADIAPAKYTEYSCDRADIKSLIKLRVPVSKGQSKEYLKAYNLQDDGNGQLEFASLGGYVVTNEDSTENYFEVKVNSKDLDEIFLMQEIELMDPEVPESTVKIRVRGFEELETYANYDFSRVAIPNVLTKESNVFFIPHKSYDVRNLTSQESIRIVGKGGKKDWKKKIFMT